MVKKKRTWKRLARITGITCALAVLTGCGIAGKAAVEEADAADLGKAAVKEADAADLRKADREGSAVREEIALEKSPYRNPVSGDGDDCLYGGDPSVLVDGDIVYLYTGHDVSTDEEVRKSIYNIPEYLCYSTTDMTNWKYEGVVMTMDTVSWAKDATSAWAAQVAKHYDEAEGKDKYYLYFCSWDKSGKQSIGVAVSDSPTGVFVDIGEPLVRAGITKPPVSTYEDIDPTVWIETDENGEEHRYLAWGNSNFFVCELNEDMISVKDINGDGEITGAMQYGEGDVINRRRGLDNFTEAAWIYRRKDENGNYYGDYYLFFAYGWRECMAYVTTDNLFEGEWSVPNIIMFPTATSNTNHMAVFDFQDKSYFMYHNGALPAGSGYRRCPSVIELTFDEDGKVLPLSESASGLAGTTVQICAPSGEKLTHDNFLNSTADADYPIMKVAVGTFSSEDAADSLWVLCPGKADRADESYVSIQSENKQGLYLTANEDGTVTLSQDTDASEETAKRQTFRSVGGIGDTSGVSFESVARQGWFLALKDGVLCLTDNPDEEETVFSIR